MNLLAIDTSTDYLSIAVMRGEKIACRIHKKAAMRHSMLLVPEIDQALKKARLKMKDIDGFCVSVGPGSFTGLRIGVTTIKGLAYALKKPVAAVPTLDIIARNVKNHIGIVCPVLDARKGKVYSCLYKSDGEKTKKVSAYLLETAKELLERTEKIRSETLFLGDGTDFICPRTSPRTTHFVRVRDGAGCRRTARKGAIGKSAGLHEIEKGPFRKWNGDWHPRAEVAARLGRELFDKKKTTGPADLEPLYLYSKECDITGR